MTRRTPARLLAAAGLIAACAATVPAADVVILKDGFVIQGHVSKEIDSVRDPNTGRVFAVAKSNGFDMADEGPKLVIFSSHARQLGEVGKDAKIRPEYKHYLNKFPGRKSDNPFPGGGVRNMTPFDAKWRRTITYDIPPNLFEKVEQQITFIDPYTTYLVSPTHLWRQGYRTAEMNPFEVRKLLATHPELAEADGKLDPAKRAAIAQFMKDAGWLALAKQEIDAVSKEFTGEMTKEAKDAFEKVKKEADAATAELVVKEAELALVAGRYKFAGEVLAAFPEKLAEPKEIDRASKAMAQLKTVKDRYDTGRRLLRWAINEAVGDATPYLATVGGAATVTVRKKDTDTPTKQLAAAAEAVLAELHPDTAERIEFFVNLASQVERERLAGKEPSKRPDELLATAVSAWAKGKNGATPLPASALRIWAGREMALNFQASDDLNTRNNLVNFFKKNNPLPIDELAQVISLLPPADPEDLANRAGTPLPPEKNLPDVYVRRTPQTLKHAKGIEYLVKLPPEYHHGRAYPVVIAVTHAGNDPDQIVGMLSRDAERNGYILVSPVWRAPKNAAPADMTGADHLYVTHVLRDVVRHFTVDNDRVFLIGAGEGATMVMDVGLSHPDLFAGVIPVGPPHPKWGNHFQLYWQNGQKLPFFAVTGELAKESFRELRLLYERWMMHGFPSLLTVYKGRGIEWFAAEMPVMFDWMGRKKRANGAAILRLDNSAQQLAWHTMREADNRFYWIGINGIAPQHIQGNQRPGVPAVPAKVTADLKGANQVTLQTIGVRNLTVWLSRDMIDWTRPVRVALNGAVPQGWAKGKLIEPDLGVLLEDYRDRGDRRMLYMGKFDLQSGN